MICRQRRIAATLRSFTQRQRKEGVIFIDVRLLEQRENLLLQTDLVADPAYKERCSFRYIALRFNFLFNVIIGKNEKFKQIDSLNVD